MKSTKDYPSGLRPFVFCGVDIEHEKGDEGVGTCPFCGREKKFYVNATTGLWNCKTCGDGGNPSSFIVRLLEESIQSTTGGEELAADRGIENWDTMLSWGLAKSMLTDEWILPGYNADGKVNTLYRYVENAEGKRRLYVCPETNHGLMGMLGFDPKKPFVYVCEGPWDGMVLQERLSSLKTTKAGLEATGSVEASLFSKINVLAVPSCSTFYESWGRVLDGKVVTFFYDSDHPRQHCKACKKSYSVIDHSECPGCGGELVPPLAPPSGYEGVKKAVRTLAKAEGQPKETWFLNWGPEGYDPNLPSGTDVRDVLLGEGTQTETLTELIGRTSPIPADWLGGEGADGSVRLSILPCETWTDLRNSWRKAMKWTDGLDRGLSFSLAVVVSTPVVGDQLWGKMIGPPSSGKSQICEALSTCRKYVYPLSTLTGFHSGWKGSGEDSKKDHGMIPKIKDKTLVTKDGDTIISLPNKDQVLGQARDLYDGSAAGSYKNQKSYDHVGLRVTWLLCGTEALKALDNESDLGGRFLDCVIMERMDEEMEKEIDRRVARRVARQMGMSVDGRPETDGPEMTDAKRKTGGYVQYLRENGQRLFSELTYPDEMLDRCGAFAEFVSFMRARPSSRNTERAQRELSPRLTAQLTKLAASLAVVLNRKTLDEEVMRRVRQVALDTSRGRALEVTKALYLSDDGMLTEEIALSLAEPEGKIRDLLFFMRKIGAVGLYRSSPGKARGTRGYGKPKWKLTPRIQRLYEEVLGDA